MVVISNVAVASCFSLATSIPSRRRRTVQSSGGAEVELMRELGRKGKGGGGKRGKKDGDVAGAVWLVLCASMCVREADEACSGLS